MSAETRNFKDDRPDARWLYRVGGISGLLIGLGYIVIIALYVPMGAPATEAEARLAQVAANTTNWQAILWLSVLTDFLFVPLAVALYFALKSFNRSVMILATLCVMLFVFLDLTLTWPNYGAIISLSSGYAAAAEAEKTVYVTAAMYPAAILESLLLFVCNSLTLALGILLTGLVMLRGIFNKVIAYIGILTGVLGLIAVLGPVVMPALSSAIIVASLLTTVWTMLAGYRLFRLALE